VSITSAARCKARTVMAHSKNGLMGSNSTRAVDICVYYVFVLSCVYVGSFRRADPQSKESYRLRIGVRIWRRGLQSHNNNNEYTVHSTAWTRDQPVTSRLPTHRTTQAQNNRTQTSWSGILAHDSSIWVLQDSWCLRPCGGSFWRPWGVSESIQKAMKQFKTDWSGIICWLGKLRN
jgi:hypothetical protein